MDLTKQFELKPTGELILLKVAKIETTFSHIITPDSVAENVEHRSFEVVAVGPKLKQNEWGFEVGDLVMIVGQPVGNAMFPKFALCYPASICAVIKKKEFPDA